MEGAYTHIIFTYPRVQFAPINYVAQVDPLPVPLAQLNKREHNLYNIPLNGCHIGNDNKTFFCLLANLLSGTTGYAWIHPFECYQNGHTTWLDLSNTMMEAHRRASVLQQQLLQSKLPIIRMNPCSLGKISLI